MRAFPISRREVGMRRWDGLVEEYVAACRARGLAESAVANIRCERERSGCPRNLSEVGTGWTSPVGLRALSSPALERLMLGDAREIRVGREQTKLIANAELGEDRVDGATWIPRRRARLRSCAASK